MTSYTLMAKGDNVGVVLQQENCLRVIRPLPVSRYLSPSWEWQAAALTLCAAASFTDMLVPSFRCPVYAQPVAH